jgi:hypothetical protein
MSHPIPKKMQKRRLTQEEINSCEYRCVSRQDNDWLIECGHPKHPSIWDDQKVCRVYGCPREMGL